MYTYFVVFVGCANEMHFGLHIQSGIWCGFELLEGSSKEGTAFMKAFDDSNAFIYMRYINPFWKLKRLLNIGSEAALKNNVKIIDDFVHGLINTKRQLLSIHKDSVSSLYNFHYLPLKYFFKPIWTFLYLTENVNLNFWKLRL